MKARGADLRLFLFEVDEHDLDEFEDLALEFLNDQRKVKGARTIERYIGSLRGFGRWAGLSDPIDDYIAPKAAKPQPHPLHEGFDGVVRMLKVARTHDHKCLVALTGLVGLRVGEAVTVTVDDVDLVARTITVRGKGDRTRVVPVSDLAMEVLAYRLTHPDPDDRRIVRLYERTARKVITRLGERAGLSRRASSHDMRATFATEAYRATNDIRAVQELLGHADTRTTQVYTGISMDAMRKAANAVGSGDKKQGTAA